ncbi:MAG: hypothetical protein ACXVAU_07740, partial [Mucilaginibacter sp.]
MKKAFKITLRKKLRILQVAFFFISAFTIQAQTVTAPCNALYPNYTVQSTAQPTNCNQLLQDFIPKPGDRNITVNVNFWVFNDNSGGGRWSACTSTQADNAISQINTIYGSIQPPTEPLATPATVIGDSKIRFVKKSYNQINSTTAYEHIGHMTNGYFINDCNAINIIFCKSDSLSISGGNTYAKPGNYIFMPADTDLDKDSNMRTLDSYLIIPALIHELGHALGLNHTHDVEGYSSTKPVMGPNSCCDLLIADDVDLESDLFYGGTWQVRGNCTTPITYWQFSNNIMSNNDWCRTYLSPLQMAIMHYHLRTDMKGVLSAQGYTAALVVDHHFDHTVGSSETWNNDRYMKGDVIIPSGHLLTISCAVGMPYAGRIIVQPGGQLILNGSATNISGLTWSGIQVGGVTIQDQSFSTGGFATYQGVLYMTSNPHCRISNAENGVKNYLTDTLGAVSWGSIGGIVLANTADFINNTRDVEFYPNTAAPSASSFYNCTFSTDTLLNKDTSGVSVPPLTRVSLWGLEGVKFRGCTFQYNAGSAYADHGTGISGDGAYSVDMNVTTPTVFKNFRQGIYQLGVNPLYLPTIANTQFYDNVVDAVYMSGLTGMVFNSNYVQQPTSATSNGLYLQSCQQYNVRNNTFSVTTSTYKLANGIYATNSKAGAHQIYRNIFNNLHTGIGAVDTNSSADLSTGLKMNCNDFSEVSNTYDIAMMHNSSSPTVKSDQKGPGFGSQSAVRNIYGAANLVSGGENQWYIYSTPSFTINHPSNTQASTQPTPQPDYSDLGVNVSNIGIALVYSVHCLSSLSSSGNNNSGTLTAVECMSNINVYLAGLQSPNPGDVNHFEIEACLGAKLNLFLTDSLVQNKDSVIKLLEGNTGRISNADILTVYAYLKKGDTTGAMTKITALPPSRSAWAALLTQQLTYLQHP